MSEHRDKPDIGDAVCIVYPASPCDTPTTLTRVRPHRDTAPTGLDFHGLFLFEGTLVLAALIAAFVSRRKAARHG